MKDCQATWCGRKTVNPLFSSFRAVESTARVGLFSLGGDYEQTNV
jgi:hypothetical protein